MESNNSMNIDVERIIDNVSEDVESMHVDSTPSIPQPLTNPIINEIQPEEVSHIINHRVRQDMTYEFQLEFKDKTVEWVEDNKCSCEDLIGKYLRYKSITTAYLFCRVSRPEQATQFNFSLQAQELELRMFIDNLKTNGKVYDRVRVYSIASSAYRKLPEVLRRIGYSTNQGDALCVWRCDRLSRNIVDSLEFIENIHKRGVMIYSYNEHINYKQNKMRFIQAIVDANKEAMIIGERIKLSNNFKRLRGDEKIGSLPYGKEYRNNGTHKIVVDNPQEQAIIRRIKTSKLKVSELVSQLNSEGIMKKNKKWNAPMVNRIKRS